MARSRGIIVGLCAAALATALAAQVFAADPATTPAKEPAASQAKRSTEAILTDLRTTGGDLRELLPSPKPIAEAKFRKENAAKVLPTLKKLAGLMDELAANVEGPQKAGVLQSRLEILGLAVAMGDKDSEKILEQASASKIPEEAIAGKSALTMGNWVKSSEDAPAQQKLLEDFTTLAKANPENESIAQTLMMMSQFGAANADLSKKALAAIRTNMKGDAVKELITQADAEQAQKDMIGKPLAIEGRTTTGEKFTSNTLKGKVVLVDFWATWCGPCIAELPRVKTLYKTYHDKGLEIVGVDCDSADDKVNTFTKTKEMPWTQLREESQTAAAQWHPLATKYGVTGIPTMFLIDKTGTLRYIDAREDTEEKIKKLLAEPDAKKESK